MPFAHSGEVGQHVLSPLSQPQVAGSVTHGSLHVSGSLGSAHGGEHPGCVGSAHGSQVPFASHWHFGSVLGSHGGGGSHVPEPSHPHAGSVFGSQGGGGVGSQLPPAS